MIRMRDMAGLRVNSERIFKHLKRACQPLPPSRDASAVSPDPIARESGETIPIFPPIVRSFTCESQPSSRMRYRDMAQRVIDRLASFPYPEAGKRRPSEKAIQVVLERKAVTPKG